MVPKLLIPVGVILIVLGLIGVIYGGITYTKDKDRVDFGIFDIVVTEKEHVQIHPVLGAIVLAAGVVVVAAGLRRRRFS